MEVLVGAVIGMIALAICFAGCFWIFTGALAKMADQNASAFKTIVEATFPQNPAPTDAVNLTPWEIAQAMKFEVDEEFDPATPTIPWPRPDVSYGPPIENGKNPLIPTPDMTGEEYGG